MLVAQSPCAVRCWWVIHRKGFRCWEVWKTDKIRLNIFLGVGSLRAWRWLSYMIKPWSHTSKTFMASWCCWWWLCVCVLCACLEACICVFMSVHECLWRSEVHVGCHYFHTSHLPFQAVFVIELGVYWFARPVGQWIPGFLLRLSLHTTGVSDVLPCLAFYVATWNPNLGPQA